MATPLLADLRRFWPHAEIVAMCQSNVAPLLEADPSIDEIFAFSRPSGFLHRQAHRDIIERLRRGEYDLGILTTNSFSSAWWFFLGKVKKRVGFARDFRRFLLSLAVPRPQDESTAHLVSTYKRLLAPLGISPSDTPPRLFLLDEEKKRAQDLLACYGVTPGQVIVGMHPGAAFGTAKCWLPERFRAVTERLLEDPRVTVLYFGDGPSASVVKDICEGLPSRVVNLAKATSLRELMALIECCHVFLTNDSGPMHIASALGTPLVALFGSTSPIKTGPYNGGTILYKGVACSPCYKRVCPIDFPCMKEISVEEVYAEIRREIDALPL